MNRQKLYATRRACQWPHFPEIGTEIGLVIEYKKTSCYKEAAAGEGTKSEIVASPSLRDLPARPFSFSERNPFGILVAVVFRPRRRWSVCSFPSRRKSLWVPAPPVSRCRHASPSTHPLPSATSRNGSRILLGGVPHPSRGSASSPVRIQNPPRCSRIQRGRHPFVVLSPTISYCCESLYMSQFASLEVEFQ